jgi:two-component system, sensor histidine kinase and response regulator
LQTMASAKGSKGMRRTALLAPEEVHAGGGEVSQAAGIDDHLAKTVTPERRLAVAERWRTGRGCEDRVADERDVLDTQVLAALQELERMSRRGLLARLITLYLQEVPAQLAALHEAVAHGDAGRVEEVTHGLRGSAAQLGATRMTSVCTSLQEDAGTHNLSRAAARVADLTREFSRVQAALEAVLRHTPPPDA